MSLEEKESDDVRIDYIGSITTLVLQIDSGLWAELIWKEDNVLIIKDFLDTPKTRLLLIYVDKNNRLLATTDFPTQRPLSSKFMYFLKSQEIAIALTDFRHQIMHGSLDHCPLKQYQALFQQVIMPIFSNPKNNTKWPAEVFKDIKLHFQDFRKTLYYCVGQANGKTVLPIPEIAKQVDLLDVDTIDRESVGDSNTRAILNSIGDMVIDWATLISEVLEAGTAEDPLSEIESQGPLSEIVFWNARKENLQFIFHQINEPHVKKMARLLQKVGSCYNEAFVKLLRNMVEALAEAEDIASSLQNLNEPFQKLCECPFLEMKQFIPELMNTTTSSWINSKYFKSVPSRIGVLVIKICNQIIEKVRAFLDGPNLFHKERSSSEKEIKEAKETLDAFLDSYYKCRDDMESTFEHAKLYPWEFPDERVFSRLSKFMQRLNDIQDLFDAADTYIRIPKFDIRGLQQMELKCRLYNIHEEFFQQYKGFEDSNCDILDLNIETFQENYEQFRLKIRDLDCRLGAAISQGCIQSSPTTEAFKLMEMFSCLIKRPLVEIEFRNCVPNLIMNIRSELILARQMHDNNVKCIEEKGFCTVYINMPIVSGSLLWAAELKEKLAASMDGLEDIKKYFITENDAEAEYQIYNELTELLTKFQKDIYLSWVKNTDGVIGTMVDQPVLIEDENGRITVNYDMRITEIIDEVKLLLKIEQEEIPKSAVGLKDQHTILRYVRSVLTSTANWYNALCKDLVPFEKILIASQWEEIKSLLEKGKKIIWKSSGLKDFASNVFNITKATYESVRNTKENINEVRKLIECWTKRAMYARETPTATIDLRIYMTDAIREQYNDVKFAALRMKEKMENNLQLFKCDPKSQEWLDYVQYLETVIEDGLINAALFNLQYLFDNTDSTNTKSTPYIKVRLVLDPEEGLIFVPRMMGHDAGSLLHSFQLAIDKIYEMAEQAKRMTDDQQTYVNALNDCEKLSTLKLGIIQHVIQAVVKVTDAIREFCRYEDFWIISIEETLEDFLLYGPTPVYEEEEEEEEFGDTDSQTIADMPPLELKAPTEEEFKEQISKFEQLYHKAEDIQIAITAENWLIVDMTSFKEDLLLTIRKWIVAYKESLIEQKNLGKLQKIVKEELD